jgi:hypothetical protein
VQFDEEWAVYDAQLIFNAFPPDFQSEYQGEFNQWISTIASANATFIAAVNTALAAGGNTQVFIAELLGAITDLAALVNQLIVDFSFPDAGLVFGPDFRVADGGATGSVGAAPALSTTASSTIQGSLSDMYSKIHDIQAKE